ncbi:MAG: CDP-alcohol phosphatidyltransferase family protein [Leptospiraceae bacterium]|nr:CDP-alcohol phosphatidyltransferase family protein [Leptospiraceae bacterium]
MSGFKSKLGWVPNLFTLSNLTLGFLATLTAAVAMNNSASEKLLMTAGAFIFLAMLCDGADGFAARLLDARSNLGAQLDSLADLATFGIAPGVMMYAFILHDYNYPLTGGVSIPTGMLLTAIYPACAAFRLARFNVVHDDDSFVGLPSPVSGIIVGLMPVAFGDVIQIPEVILIAIYLLCAFLMVSTIKYAKPQVTVLRRFSPVRLAIVAIFIAASLVFVGWRYGFAFAAAGLFTIIIVYVVIGIVALIIHAIQEYRM